MKFLPLYKSKVQQIPSKSALIMLTMLLFACNQQPKTETTSAPVTSMDSAMTKPDVTKVKYTVAMVDNKKDPSCGMPVTAGIEDTVHYNGKVYGFCSDECKQAFLKNPDLLAKSAEMK
jgi:YHS domain-containing protein